MNESVLLGQEERDVSKILHSSVHFLGRVAGMEKDQHVEMLANGVFFLMAVGDSSVAHTAGVQAKKIVVMSDNHAAVAQGKGDMVVSLARASPASDVVVTSIPCARRPTAIAE